MTTVALQTVPPKTCWTVDVEEKDGKMSEPKSLFTNNNETKVEVDDGVVPRRKMTMAEGLRPLLASMKMFGLYFDLPSEGVGDDRKEKWKRNAYKSYAVAVVVLLWINAVRMFSTFTREDGFGLALFNKLTSISWFVQCAVMQTTFYAASVNGRLAVAFDQVLDDSCAKHARKFSTVYAVLAWSIIAVSSAFTVYGFADGGNDHYLTPLQNHIVVSNPLVPRIIACLVILYVSAAFTFSVATTFVLALIFSCEFKKINETLKRLLDNDRQRQVSESDIETLRQKHQQISMSVSHVDDCLMFSNAAAFCCQVFSVVVLLYVLIFYHSVMGDAVIIVAYVVSMFTCAFGLLLAAAGGIIVHHHVRIHGSITVARL